LNHAIEPDTILVAHNAEFDSKFLPEVKHQWLCTMRTAKHLWPNAPGFSNQTLRYHLGITPLQDYVSNRYPHQALYDVATTAALLLRMLHEHTPEKLLELSNKPVMLKTVTFGKHRGKPYTQVPTDYLQWIQSSGKWDSDVSYTVEQELQQRAK
jgi:exodeoxyribonuclease X